MKYFNETEQEYLQRKTRQYANALSGAMRQMNIFKSDIEIWQIVEKEVKERHNRGAEL